MNYYVIEIAEGDAKIKGVSIGTYATKDEAVASFHSKMGTAMKSELYTREQLLVIDKFNNPIKSEVFERETVDTVTE